MKNDNEINDLTPSDLVYLFVDGEATEAEKSVLFNELSTDSNLQIELQNAISMKTVAFHDSNNTVVPAALSNKVFSAVGIGSGVAAIGASAANMAGKSSFWGIGTFYSIISALAGSLITFLLMGNLMTNEVNKEIVSGDNSKQYQASNLSMTNDTIIMRDTIFKDRVVVKNIEKIIEKEIYKEANIDNLAKSDENNEIALNEQNKNESEKIDNSSLNIIDTVSKTVNIIENKLESIIEQENSSFWKDFSINLNSINALTYLPGRSGIVAEQPLINNFSIGLKYQISDNFRTGITIGKESYPIFIKESDENIYPISSLTYYGLNFDFDLFTLSDTYNLKSDLRLFLGGTKLGFYGKSGVGIIWAPYNNIDLNLGLESTVSVSNFNNKEDLTGKIGFYYGISYRF